MSTPSKYVKIAFNLPVNRLFTYSVPPGLQSQVGLGKRVLAPFGSRQLTGYIVGISDTNDLPRVKDILNVLDEEPLINSKLLELTRWMAEYYLCPWGVCLACALPKGIGKIKPLAQKYCQLSQPVSVIEQELGALNRRAPKQAAALLALMQAGGELDLQALGAKGITRSSINPLINKGLISIIERPGRRKIYAEAISPSCSPKLLPSQQAVVRLAANGLKQRQFLPILLHGITGSGKTEVYLNSIEQAIAHGRKALVLVPEISLTAQLWQRFHSRFNSQVAILHSQLSAGERLDEWHRLQRGEATIAIGARSAVFAPLADVGLIVVDEEHETSYKQENHPRYHARQVALVRGQLEQAVVILGSATPSLESFYCCQTKAYHKLSLPARIENRPLPRVEIVDMRHQPQEGGLSTRLVQAIGQRFERREQTLLFLNRRGYAPFILCQQCGQVLSCPQCSVSLTYHLKGRARCHYCNYSIIPPRTCPSCKGDQLQYFGLGTQRLESQLSALFPEARIARMDRDTTNRKGAHWRIFQQLQAREIDILIGTQMVTKGFDLPGITLVGVIAADLGLGLPDFRAGERTFQLLTQVAGRAGRGDIPGEVIIQTYNPQHYSIQAAKHHHYQRFYEQEIKYRKSLLYPPITRMVNLMLVGKHKQRVAQTARWLANKFKENHTGIQLLGPSPAIITKIKGEHRWQLILRGIRSSDLHSALENAINALQQQSIFKGVRLEVDVDPVSLL